ncbi:Pentatricopeptide repeat [Dillenia turbinata]|uniref:Pentatricopeptide repeat n=1 Tax=Dillenia turbinata TaxID=194707 RepID=A0AAN8VB95_9MAGN
MTSIRFHCPYERAKLSMRTLTIVRNLRIFEAIRRTMGLPSQAFQTLPFFANLRTQTSKNSCEEESVKSTSEENKSLSFRIERLLRGESVGSAFQKWMGEGLPIHGGEIFHAINRLRKLNHNKRALEVMEWVIRERPYRLKELDYSYLLEFTAKLHGISQAEELFSRIPPEKTIPRILVQMKADKVVQHVSTYNILLKMEANEHNIEGLQKVFEEMKKAKVEPNEITYCILATAHAVARLWTVTEAYVDAVEKSMTGNNWSTLDVLIILYGYLGKEKGLERIWSNLRALPHIRSKSFVLAIEAFGRVGQLHRAEELWQEMTSEKGLTSTEQFNSLIAVYCKSGYVKKASEIFKEMKANGCKPNAITFRHLALGCLKADLLEEALRTLELRLDFTASNKVLKSAPWLETTFSMVEIFAEKGDVQNAESLFEELSKAKYTRYTFVYNTLIKAYVKAKIYDPNLLRRMILGGSRPDAETYSLMKLVEQFRP